LSSLYFDASMDTWPSEFEVSTVGFIASVMILGFRVLRVFVNGSLNNSFEAGIQGSYIMQHNSSARYL